MAGQGPARPGEPEPLGATVVDGGVNFAVFSRHGTRAFVSVYDPTHPDREQARLLLPGRTGHVFHGFVPGLPAGTPYGFRVEGPYSPWEGHRFNPHKLLFDPYARAVTGRLDWSGPIYGYDPLDPDDRTPDPRDDAASVPKAVVVPPDDFDWQGGRRPATAWSDTVIYELHVKGFTRLHPDVPPAQRGTYAALGHPAVVDYLRRLGVTAIELLPIHLVVDEGPLVARGQVNYWGYNSLGFFTPDPRYAADKSPGGAARELKTAIRALHAAGIEVLLDVVYNHTCEGNHAGPTLSFRGLDNASYYLLEPGNRARHSDHTGCGNSVAAATGHPMKLVLDSLRFWVEEMHVDGFRFDLATTLGRMGPEHRFTPLAPSFEAMLQDPTLARCKLIAEPWDAIGYDAYQAGRFPVCFSEWNGPFRDTLRRFWRGDAGHVPPLGGALTGSAHLFEPGGRTPRASINYVTSHDGFTMRDLVSYERKHNEANGEGNRDGWDDNASTNHGVEGETGDPTIGAARGRHVRNLLASLLLARGVPMLLAGDERGRTQLGNNNAYCQDNEISWVDWTPSPEAERLRAFVERVIAVRRALPLLTEDRYYHFVPGVGGPELDWVRPDGTRMRREDWEDPTLRTLGMLVRGNGAVAETGPVLVLVHAAPLEVPFVLPPLEAGRAWRLLLDTAHPPGDEDASAEARVPPGAAFPLAGRSLALLRAE